MSFGNWLKDMLVIPEKEAPDFQRPYNPGHRPIGTIYTNGERDIRYGWEHYVNFAVRHAKAGGTFNELLIDHTDNWDGSNFLYEEDYAGLPKGTRPGEPMSLPLHANMIEEVCLRLRREGLRFPIDQIVHSFTPALQSQPGRTDSRAELVERAEGKYNDGYGYGNVLPWDFRPLSEGVAMVEARLDELEQKVGRETALAVTPADGPHLRPATEDDYLNYLADHLEAGGTISISDSSPAEDFYLGLGQIAPYATVKNRWRVTADRKRMLQRMGVNDFSNQVLVAEKDFWLTETSGDHSFRILCKPGVKQITTKAAGDIRSNRSEHGYDQIMVPGELEDRSPPEIGRDYGQRLGKILRDRGISIRADQIEQHEHKVSVQKFWNGEEPDYKSDGPIVNTTPSPATP
ncbi:MAG: hypothetical protein Alpg2KO_17230 [Alphaproteobacteria bacterium]